MKKIPFGFLTGLFAILLFYLTAAVVALYVILNIVAGATGQSVNLFDNWYQTLLFVLDVICVIGFVVCLVFLILKKRGEKEAHVENI